MDRGAWKVYALFIYFTKVQLEKEKKKHFLKYVTGFQQASYAVKHK